MATVRFSQQLQDDIVRNAEIMFDDKFWPDFTTNEYKKCLNNFTKVSRRFGKRI